MEAEERPRKIRKLSHHSQDERQQLVSPVDGNIIESEGQVNLPNVDSVDLSPVQPENGDDALPSAPHEHGSADEKDANAAPLTLSKNQLKKLRRQQQWEASKADRIAKRKEKTKERKERKRAAKQNDSAEIDKAPPDTLIPEANGSTSQLLHKQHPHQRPIQLPITFIFDCDFDDLMSDKERVSLASQLTRCYSDNKNAHFRAHLVISSFKGKLRERFDGVLAKHYMNWTGVRFFDEDFVTAAEQSMEWMRKPGGGKFAGVFAKQQQVQQQPNQQVGQPELDGTSDDTSSTSDPTGEKSGEVVYLTSDSPNTLTSLRPYSTYIIGGLVDRNRHKGICYKRALDRDADPDHALPIKTAKLPIAEFLDMTSRTVLATNHVCEIMLRWLECGDWGKAFMKVMPKRKGGALKVKENGVTKMENEDRDLSEDGGVDVTENTGKGEEKVATAQPSEGAESVVPEDGALPVDSLDERLNRHDNTNDFAT